MAAWAGRPEASGSGAMNSPNPQLPRVPTADDACVIAAGGCPLGDLAAQHVAFKFRSRQPFADIRSAAERGDLAGQYLVAVAYYNGDSSEGIPQDRREAIVWLTRAAAGNVTDACALLGQAYELGMGGLPAGSPEALQLYARAAEAGHTIARYRLGVCYFHGVGVAKDAKAAVRHWRIAADEGWASAQADLSQALINGIGTPVDYAAGRKYACLADAQGHPHAPLQLGLLAYNGWGEPADYGAGIGHITRAAAMGVEQAVGLLRSIAADGHEDAAAALKRLAVVQQHTQPAGKPRPQPESSLN